MVRRTSSNKPFRFTEFTVTDFHAQSTNRVIDDLAFIRTKENQTAIFGTSARQVSLGGIMNVLMIGDASHHGLLLLPLTLM